MNKIITTIISIFLFFPLNAENSVDSLLHILDATINDTQVYVNKKEQKLNDLTGQLILAQTELCRFELLSQLYEGYRSFKNDSASVYAEKMLETALSIGNKDLIFDSQIALAFSRLSAGLYKETSAISQSIDTSEISVEAKARLYSFHSVLYLSMADFAAIEPYCSKYRKVSLNYTIRAIDLYGENNPDAMLDIIRKYQILGDYMRAIEIAQKYIATLHPGMHNYAIANSMLGYFNKVSGNTQQAIECFARAAISDIKLAIKETTAIRQLAELIFMQGDVKRAYFYAILAMDDANFYNARQRKLEVGRILPIINAGRFEIIEQQKNNLMIFSVIISVLFVLFVTATFIILSQKKRLNIARELILKQYTELNESNLQLIIMQDKIIKQNEDLLTANKRLKEAHQIKDEYIGYFFSTNSSYLEKREEFRRNIARKIKNQQFDKLMDEFAAIDLRKEKEEMLGAFDQIFMKIFPDFVNKYNHLFNDEDKFTLKPDGILSPEIRIFALKRLGINKSEQIARFLDFSISTVKNYKSIAKCRSIIPNDIFEKKIMEIESVETSNSQNY